jgi:putative ABC transport system permease protein
MMVTQTARVALRALLKNRLRSILTMLGIIIGVGAFVAMVAIGEGARVQVLTGIQGMGSNMLVVFPGAATQGGARGGAGSSATLTLPDAQAIETLSQVQRAAPIARGGAQVVYGGSNWSTSVIGTTPAYLGVRSWTIKAGEMFSDDDGRVGAKVCVVGQTVVKNLFGEGANPVGEVIRVRDMACRIVGTLEEKGSNGFGNDDDDVVVVPLSTFKRRLFGGDPQQVNTVIVSAIAPEATGPARTQIEELLRQRHRIREGVPDDFQVRDLKEVAKTFSDTLRVFGVLLGSIALISLLVGGIGIMNIMLVSVTERTREIGIRVALGARSFDILSQFLVEAVLLSVLGGGLGVGLGVWGSGLAARLTEWPRLVTPETLVLAFGFAALVGVIFGLYPAIRASRLDPIDALRYE